MSQIEIQNIISFLNVGFTGLLVLGIFAAFKQASAARHSMKAQVLMKLYDEWRNPELYQAVIYIQGIRAEWKEKKIPLSDWDNAAKEWVDEHVGKNAYATDPQEHDLGKQWMMRRTASQFLCNMGLMINSKYITPVELFSVIPEMPRLLTVLIPIGLSLHAQRFKDFRTLFPSISSYK